MNKEIGFRGGKIPDKTGIGSKEEAWKKLNDSIRKIIAEFEQGEVKIERIGGEWILKKQEKK